MNYILDQEDGTLYQRLYRNLRDDIISGTYKHGSRLPSKRMLAEETGVSTITVEHAYELLCDEGYAEARERSGYFVIFKEKDGFASSVASRTARETMHSAGSALNLPFPVLSKAMRRVLSSYGEVLLSKTDNKGCLELRSALKNYLARNRGIHTSEQSIVLGSGSEYLYGLIVELLGRDRVFAIEAPSYNKIELVYAASGVQYEMLPLKEDGIDSLSLANTKSDILHTTPYRSYPSGVTASASKRHEYIRWASEGGKYLIEDDFESEFSVSTMPMETLFSLSDMDNVIYLNTFSKTISPSVRVAYMVLPKRLTEIFDRHLGFYSCTVPSFEQYLLLELIESGEFERHINRVRRGLRRDRGQKTLS